jgi:hypothetical protein
LISGQGGVSFHPTDEELSAGTSVEESPLDVIAFGIRQKEKCFSDFFKYIVG